ncbi:hypothetical protein H4582DRAFT_1600069 [Lactarius indigo]|nr:hypothetical protein H4582DRAFT_1600069 [Lactarius indigo]
MPRRRILHDLFSCMSLFILFSSVFLFSSRPRPRTIQSLWPLPSLGLTCDSLHLPGYFVTPAFTFTFAFRSCSILLAFYFSVCTTHLFLAKSLHSQGSHQWAQASPSDLVSFCSRLLIGLSFGRNRSFARCSPIRAFTASLLFSFPFLTRLHTLSLPLHLF